MKTTRKKLNFYRRVRTALLATNNRTDSSIITACNIAKPIANDKGIPVVSNDKGKKRSLVPQRTSSFKINGMRSRRG